MRILGDTPIDRRCRSLTVPVSPSVRGTATPELTSATPQRAHEIRGGNGGSMPQWMTVINRRRSAAPRQSSPGSADFVAHRTGGSPTLSARFAGHQTPVDESSAALRHPLDRAAFRPHALDGGRVSIPALRRGVSADAYDALCGLFLSSRRLSTNAYGAALSTSSGKRRLFGRVARDDSSAVMDGAKHLRHPIESWHHPAIAQRLIASG